MKLTTGKFANEQEKQRLDVVVKGISDNEKETEA